MSITHPASGDGSTCISKRAGATPTDPWWPRSRLLYSPRVSDAGDEADQGAGPAPEPGTPAPAKLRRSVFGYRRADVDRVLEDRDALLAELRQDVAALWLAFAQHDRMIREGLRGQDAVAPRGEEVEASPTAELSPDALAAAEDSASIGRQLADLDEVLAAIEIATGTLERTYAEEIATEPEDGGDRRGSRPEAPPDAVEEAEPDAREDQGEGRST